LGIQTIFEKLQSWGWDWPGMSRLFQRDADNCSACQLNSLRRPVFELMRPTVALEPWAHIQYDLASNLIPTEDGFRYLLVVIDVFSGYLVLSALRTKNSPEIASSLWKIFSTLGLPKIMQSDREPTLRSQVMKDFIKIVGAYFRGSIPYEPHANGKVERNIQTVMTVVNKLLHTTGQDWVRVLPFVQLCLNDKYSDQIGCSAFQLMFNRKPNLLETWSYLPMDGDVSLNYARWRQNAKLMNDVIFPAVEARHSEKKKKQIAQFHAKHEFSEKPLPIGTVVMLKDISQVSKADSPYLGRYIIKRYFDGAYTLEDATGNLFNHDVPRHRLKELSLAEKPEAEHRVLSIVNSKNVDGVTWYEVLFADGDKCWLLPKDISDNALIRKFWGSKSKLKLPPVIAK